MIDNPISSWASMQIGGGDAVAKYTPGDVANAQAEAKKEQARMVEQKVRQLIFDKMSQR